VVDVEFHLALVEAVGSGVERAMALNGDLRRRVRLGLHFDVGTEGHRFVELALGDPADTGRTGVVVHIGDGGIVTIIHVEHGAVDLTGHGQ